MMLETLKERLEHIVQLWRGLIPPDNRVAEPEKTLDSIRSALMTDAPVNPSHTLAIPAGFVCTNVQSPRKAESFSSLSRIS